MPRKTWDADEFRDKPARKKRPRFVSSGADDKDALICDNCGFPIALAVEPHCRCNIWDVGKRGR